MGAKHFGARVTRFEDPALLAGRGRFVDDVPLPGALNACFVRSPHGHARIRSIDTQAALRAAGRARRADRRRPAGADAQRAHPEPDGQSSDPHHAHPACAGARRGLLRRAGGGGGDRRQPAGRGGRRRPGRGRLRRAAGGRGLPRGGEARQPERAFRHCRQRRRRAEDGIRRRRRRLRQGRACVRGAVLDAPRRRHVDGDPRGGGKPRCRERFPHGVVLDPDAASRPRHPRRSSGPQSRKHPHDRARRRRRLRAQGAVLPGGGGDPGRRHQTRSPGADGSRTGASISSAPRRSATSTGRSPSRSTPTAKSSACAARCCTTPARSCRGA